MTPPTSGGRRLMFAAAPVAALLLLAECGARIAGASDCEPIVPDASGWDTMVGDPELLWALEAGRELEGPGGITRINAVGLRTPLLPETPRAVGEKRVLVTGDSSVYGWGQPDGYSYAEQLEQVLDKTFPGTPIKVVNLGVPGYSTEQTLRLLDRIGWSYGPDLLVVHNIFSDANIDAFQDAEALALANPDGTPLRAALHTSRAYCAAYMPWARYQATLNQEPGRVLMPGIPTGANAAVALERVDTLVDLSRVPLSDYLANLDRIRATAEARGASMVVAPLAQELDVGLWSVPMPRPGPDQVLPWFPYRSSQDAWAAEAGVGRISLPEVFAAEGGDPTGLFIDTMHPSVRGAQVMAWAVASHLRDNPQLLDLSPSDVGPLPARPRLPNVGPQRPPNAQGGPGGRRSPSGKGGVPQAGEGHPGGPHGGPGGAARTPGGPGAGAR